jgi:hypothetical protein
MSSKPAEMSSECRQNEARRPVVALVVVAARAQARRRARLRALLRRITLRRRRG